LNLVFAGSSILGCLFTFLVINPLVDLKFAKQAVNATEIGALKSIEMWRWRRMEISCSDRGRNELL